MASGEALPWHGTEHTGSQAVGGVRGFGGRRCLIARKEIVRAETVTQAALVRRKIVGRKILPRAESLFTVSRNMPREEESDEESYWYGHSAISHERASESLDKFLNDYSNNVNRLSIFKRKYKEIY
jgi:hypothetical protein